MIISRLPSGGILSPKTIPITLNLEGANEDAITIYDINRVEQGLCVFPTNSTTGQVQLNIKPDEEYIFESAVAKDIETGTGNYSKNVTLTKSLTNAKVMPDGAVFWWGNECVETTGGWERKNNNRYDSNLCDCSMLKHSILTNGKVAGSIISSWSMTGFINKKSIDISKYSKIKFNSKITSGAISTNSHPNCYGFDNNEITFRSDGVPTDLNQYNLGSETREFNILKANFLWMTARIGSPTGLFSNNTYAIWLE